MNHLLIEALARLDNYFGPDLTVEVPTGSGNRLRLLDASKELGRRLVSIFADDANGRRPVFAGYEVMQTDPDWHDLLPFHEYFHGDTGAGLGAAHQTGWTALVADLITSRRFSHYISIAGSGVGRVTESGCRVRAPRTPLEQEKQMRVWRGRPHPLGATWDGRGVNVAVFSDNATRIDLCLFDSADATDRIGSGSRCPPRTGRVWHGYFPDLRPGQLYGLRADGPYDPTNGHRFNVNKLLFDPYAKAVGRDLSYDDTLYGYAPGADDLSFDARDSAAHAPARRGRRHRLSPGRRTTDHSVLWPTRSSTNCTSRASPSATRAFRRQLRGTYAGLASPAAIDHILGLGANAVELLPVHYRVSEPFLVAKGLSNYWGYNTLGFFAPDPRLAAADRSARRRAGVQDDGGHAARRRHRRLPRRRLQPHGRGKRDRADAVVPRPGQRVLLPPR